MNGWSWYVDRCIQQHRANVYRLFAEPKYAEFNVAASATTYRPPYRPFSPPGYAYPQPQQQFPHRPQQSFQPQPQQPFLPPIFQPIDPGFNYPPLAGPPVIPLPQAPAPVYGPPPQIYGPPPAFAIPTPDVNKPANVYGPPSAQVPENSLPQPPAAGRPASVYGPPSGIVDSTSNPSTVAPSPAPVRYTNS